MTIWCFLSAAHVLCLRRTHETERTEPIRCLSMTIRAQSLQHLHLAGSSDDTPWQEFINQCLPPSSDDTARITK